MAENNKGIYFTELTLENVCCFGEKATLKLSNDKGEWTRWNIILGDNGTGKTTLLQCLAGMEQRISHTEMPNDEVIKSVSILDNTYWYRAFYSSKSVEIDPHSITLVDVCAMVTENHSNTVTKLGFQQFEGNIGIFSDKYEIDLDLGEDEVDIFILGYGANRQISFANLTRNDTDSNNSATLFFDDAKLINAEEWLLQMEFAASRDSEIKEQAKKRSNLIKDVLKNILPDVDDIRFRNSTDISKPLPTLEFKTPYGWVRLKELSYGYKTMVAWIVDVAARMFKRYLDSDNPLEEPVVILVDEIDLHLHPKWQRQIFDFLESRFPRAQFVVTAHSPLIVQSAPKDANIIVLRKEQQGNEFVVKIENDRNYVRNWRVDQILASDLFDNVGIRNEEVEQQMQERTTLLQKDVLTDDEKVRLEELNAISDGLPTANNPIDIEAMDIIRRAAEELKKRGGA